MNIDTEALMRTRVEIEGQIKKFEGAKQEIERLLTTEMQRVWVDESSEKLNNKFQTEGKVQLEEVKETLVKFSEELKNVVEEFNNSVKNIGNGI